LGTLRLAHARPTEALYACGQAPAGLGSPRHGTSAHFGERQPIRTCRACCRRLATSIFQGEREGTCFPALVPPTSTRWLSSTADLCPTGSLGPSLCRCFRIYCPYPPPHCRTCGRGSVGILRAFREHRTAILYASRRAPAGLGSPHHGTSACAHCDERQPIRTCRTCCRRLVTSSLQRAVMVRPLPAAGHFDAPRGTGGGVLPCSRAPASTSLLSSSCSTAEPVPDLAARVIALLPLPVPGPALESCAAGPAATLVDPRAGSCGHLVLISRAPYGGSLRLRQEPSLLQRRALRQAPAQPDLPGPVPAAFAPAATSMLQGGREGTHFLALVPPRRDPPGSAC
jgi:hypothetical protein